MNQLEHRLCFFVTLHVPLYFKKRDEEKMLKLLQKTNQSSVQESRSKAEVLNDIYGERTGTHYEYGLAELYDMDVFNAKLISLKEK